MTLLFLRNISRYFFFRIENLYHRCFEMSPYLTSDRPNSVQGCFSTPLGEVIFSITQGLALLFLLSCTSLFFVMVG